MWVNALRSGEYKQGKEALHFGDEFCCLGVLCDLHAKETGNEWKPEEDGSMSYDGDSAVLPDVVARWAGLVYGGFTLDNPIVRGTSLASRNDNGEPFPEIADLIEKYL